MRVDATPDPDADPGPARLRVVPPSPPSPWPEWIDTWILPYLQESALWPVLVAVLGHVVVGLVPLLLAVVRSGSVPAGLALGGLGLGSLGLCAVEARHLRRPGIVCGVTAATWACAIGLAWLCERTGVW